MMMMILMTMMMMMMVFCQRHKRRTEDGKSKSLRLTRLWLWRRCLLSLLLRAFTPLLLSHLEPCGSFTDCVVFCCVFCCAMRCIALRCCALRCFAHHRAEIGKQTPSITVERKQKTSPKSSGCSCFLSGYGSSLPSTPDQPIHPHDACNQLGWRERVAPREVSQRLERWFLPARVHCSQSDSL